MSSVDAPVPSRAKNQIAVNAIRDLLSARRFFWTIEFIPSVDKVLRDELNKLGGVADVIQKDLSLAGFAVTDRVHSDRDPDPVAAASHLLDHSGKQPLVHLSGKGRDISDFREALERLDQNGLENLLVVTGDRLKEEPRNGRPRYLESVPAIQTAKKINSRFLVAAAINPFKYREEDAMAQYLKMGKKVGAGAELVIAQIGYDMLKYEELAFWIDARNYRLSLMANVLPLSARRARYIRGHQLAGVTITDSLLALLEEEERLLPDKGESRVLRRLALQVLGVRLYGYSGVQITGIHSAEKLFALQTQISVLAESCSDLASWNEAWQESLTLPRGGKADPAPAGDPWYLATAPSRHARKAQMLKYHAMKHVHSFLFDDGIGSHLMGAMIRNVKKRHGMADHLLERFERAIKSPLFGCETCGMCRLAATQFVCPETCPKGLANGPCGGTTENLCEFRDRECVHSVKYRIAKDAGVLHELETWLIPAVPREYRHSSSWPSHFRGEGPRVDVATFGGLLTQQPKMDQASLEDGSVNAEASCCCLEQEGERIT